VSYVDVLLGTTAATTVSVTARAAGYSNVFSGAIRGQPTIKDGGVVDAAAFKNPIAPGSYVSIFGANLSDYTEGLTSATAPNALPLSLDGVTVSFDVPSAKLSVPGYLTYVSPGQVNVQAPWELQGQTSAQVKVTLYGYSYGNVVTVPLADAAPAFIESSGIAVGLDQNNAIITAANPVKAGQRIQLYMNGLGPVTGGPASGEFASKTVLTPTKVAPILSIGGQTAVVEFCGLAPGYPGLYQVNAVVPTGITPGTVPISLTISGATTKASTLPVN